MENVWRIIIGLGAGDNFFFPTQGVDPKIYDTCTKIRNLRDYGQDTRSSVCMLS